MLAVTSVTDSRYCQWGHTHWAMAQGVSLEEVNEILGHQIVSLEAKNQAEVAAILFAEHYAENIDQFDRDSIENLRRYYSDASGGRDPRLRPRNHAWQRDRQKKMHDLGCRSHRRRKDKMLIQKGGNFEE